MSEFSRYRTGLWLPDEKPMFGARLIKDHPLVKGLVLDQIFNEYGGNITFDGSGHGNHGMMHNCAWSPEGIDFNGSTSYINAGNHTSLNHGLDSFTYSAIFKHSTSTGSYSTIMMNNHIGSTSYTILSITQNTGVPYIQINTSAEELATVSGVGYDLFDSTQHRIHAVINRNDCLRLYVDAIEVGTPVDISGFSGSLNTNDDLTIGKSIRWASLFEGTIRLVRIQERALSQPKISLLHAEPYCMYEYPTLEEGMLYYPTIMNQFQRANLGADLYNGVLIT